MLASKAQLQDMENRKNILGFMRACLLRGDNENTKYFGAESARLKQRIETHDYSKENEQDKVAAFYQREWKKWTQ